MHSVWETLFPFLLRHLAPAQKGTDSMLGGARVGRQNFLQGLREKVWWDWEGLLWVLHLRWLGSFQHLPNSPGLQRFKTVLLMGELTLRSGDMDFVQMESKQFLVSPKAHP